MNQLGEIVDKMDNVKIGKLTEDSDSGLASPEKIFKHPLQNALTREDFDEGKFKSNSQSRKRLFAEIDDNDKIEKKSEVDNEQGELLADNVFSENKIKRSKDGMLKAILGKKSFVFV